MHWRFLPTLLAFFAIPAVAVRLKCKGPAAPACIFNSSSTLFSLECAAAITEYDAYQPKKGRSCKWIGFKRICSPYSARTGNCQYVVDFSCSILKREVCTTNVPCQSAKCSWRGNPAICKGRKACRFRGGSCKVTPIRKGTACYDRGVMGDNPCLKGMCNGKGRCKVVARDKEDCTSGADILNCKKGICSNDTCVLNTAPAGTKCADTFPSRTWGCSTTCCDKIYACDTQGLCDRSKTAFPPAATPCVQNPTPCIKGACDGQGACKDTMEKAPAGWPCQDFEIMYDEFCATLKCNATAQCAPVNEQDGLTCDFWKPIPDFGTILPPKLPIPPGPAPPSVPFVEPNVTGSCTGYCYRGVCKNLGANPFPCFPCFSPRDGSCEDDPTATCSCYRGDCYRDCP